jgi:membrane protein required for colicin V production
MVLDIVIAIPLLFGIYKGYKKGLLRVVLMMAFLFLGVFFGFKFIPLVSKEIELLIDVHQSIIPFLSFLIVFIFIIIAGRLVVKLIEGLFKMIYLNWINRLVGAIGGMLTVALILSTLIWLANMINLIPNSLISDSLLYSYVEFTAPLLYSFIPFLKDWFQEVELYFASYLK